MLDPSLRGCDFFLRTIWVFRLGWYLGRVSAGLVFHGNIIGIAWVLVCSRRAYFEHRRLE